ncbi:MAG: hypothetical protein COB37_05930 [Kordiimonadales bacterium]|nr:MAG: hypothetical protein COB37_05930 [Kordiimonadales bacterium]
MASQTPGLHDLFLQVKAAGYGIWRKRWAMLATAWVIALVSWVIILRMPLIYSADARVSINDTLLPEIARNLGINIDVKKKLEQVRKTVVNRTTLETIIKRTDQLDQLVGSNVNVKNALIAQMTRDIRIVSLDKNNFRILYENNDSRLTERDRAIVVKTVVDNLLSFFQQGASANNSGQTAGTRDELERAYRGYQQQTEAASRALNAFRSENFQYLGDGRFGSKRESAARDLRDTEHSISEARVREEEISIQLRNTAPTIRQAKQSSKGKSDEDPLLARIFDRQKALDDLRTQGFKDAWPDSARLIVLIDQLQIQFDAKQEKIAAELAGSLEAGQTNTLTTSIPNPLYETLFKEKIGIQADLRTFEQRLSNQQAVVNDLTIKAKSVPEKKAEEATLRATHRNLRKRAENVQEEIESLELREGFETRTEALAFNIIDAPVLPANSNGPNRLLFLFVAFAGAFVGGLGAAFMLSQLRPVIITVEQLRAQFDLPVLGNVTRILSEDEAKDRKIQMLGFAGTFMLLLLVFVGLVISEYLNLSLFG